MELSMVVLVPDLPLLISVSSLTILEPEDVIHMARASSCMTKIRYISTL